ncbi:MAG: ribbon-helix-helix domain-containing protein, partial [Reyranellaceae bacterium]
ARHTARGSAGGVAMSGSRQTQNHPEKTDGRRIAAAEGVQASLEYLYREARSARLGKPASLILAAAEATRREAVRLRADAPIDGGLVPRNVTVAGRRTSVRLEPEMWEALHEVARREAVTIHDVCTIVAQRRTRSSLTAALRVFVLGYFRAAATESGHSEVGHGVAASRDREAAA